MIAILRSIWSSLALWEWLGYASTIVVILGCIGEYIADFTRIPGDEEGRHQWSKLSLIILTLGIAGELLTAMRVSSISGAVITDLEKSVATARDSAALAKTSAATAKDDAEASGIIAADAINLGSASIRETATFGKRITAATRQADRAESDLQESINRTRRLESQLSWRSVTSDQKQVIVTDLASLVRTNAAVFRSVTILFQYPSENDEAEEYEEEIKSALVEGLRGSGVNFGDPTGVVRIGSGPPPAGVFLLVTRQLNDPAWTATARVQAALGHAGITAQADTPGSRGKITVFVAHKPRPSATEQK